MASYVPNARKPLENLQQEMDYSRGRPLNPNLDIALPTYVVENAIVCAVKRDNAAYVLDYLRKCPSNVGRYIYHEVYTSQKPMRKTITISSLLYHAIRKNALECIGVLMRHGASAFQPSYVLEWDSLQEGEPAIEIVEKPCVVWLAELMASKEVEFSARVLKHLKTAGVDMTLPVEVRVQRLQQPNPNGTKAIQYADVWECIEKTIEKISTKEQLSSHKANLKKLHSAYNTDKLETIYEPQKRSKSRKLVPPSKAEESTADATAATQPPPAEGEA